MHLKTTLFFALLGGMSSQTLGAASIVSIPLTGGSVWLTRHFS